MLSYPDHLLATNFVRSCWLRRQFLGRLLMFFFAQAYWEYWPRYQWTPAEDNCKSIRVIWHNIKFAQYFAIIFIFMENQSIQALKKYVCSQNTFFFVVLLYLHYVWCNFNCLLLQIFNFIHAVLSRNFATIYALSCGEKLSPKVHLWRKMRNMRPACDSYQSYGQLVSLRSEKAPSENLSTSFKEKWKFR